MGRILLLLLVGSALARAEPTRPNVLLIVADDLGYSDLGCYGGEIPTPHLDRLAREGVRFEKVYTSARCCPSRASLLTGRHPHEVGVGDFITAKPDPFRGRAYAGRLIPDSPTLAEVLRSNGYSTWMVGKWHLGAPGPLARGFGAYYGYRSLEAHSEDQWEASRYELLGGVGTSLRAPSAEGFYATDAFADQALAFLGEARKQGRPWFLYLAHSSPHFPIQAPKASIDRHLPTYRRGWDALRAERLERMRRLGLVPAAMALPPRSRVPVDRDDLTAGYGGRENPAWDSLPADRREDLARRMATYAAMVEHVDQGVGRLLADLERSGEAANTLVIFLSDNGACYEWGPFGFDGPSRKAGATLHRGAELERMGQAGTHSAYGSGWAMLGNTPLSHYKHFCHEGGVASPLLVRWPAGLAPRRDWARSPAHLMDVLPTVAEACLVSLPSVRDGAAVPPISGRSLLPVLRGGELAPRAIPLAHQGARGLRLGDWKLVWGKRQVAAPRWELHHLAEDPGETRDLSGEQPGKVAELAALWEDWARRVGAEGRR